MGIIGDRSAMTAVVAGISVLAGVGGATADTGGPDGYGYTYTDSNEPGGPAYLWEDIVKSGTPVVLGDDELSGALPIGFAFTFYGLPHYEFYISSNGYLTLEDSANSGCCEGEYLPVGPGFGLDSMIAGWWADFDPSSSGMIHYETLGEAPNRRLIVQITDVTHCCLAGNGESTYQYKLFEGSNVIEIHYDYAEVDQEFGACCYDDGGVESCVDGVSEYDCFTSYNGAWQGQDTNCDENWCGLTLGACCYNGGMCIDKITENDCYTEFKGDAWYVFENCTTVDCGGGGMGACCYAGDMCVDVTQDECVNVYDGFWQGSGTDCSMGLCDPRSGDGPARGGEGADGGEGRGVVGGGVLHTIGIQDHSASLGLTYWNDYFPLYGPFVVRFDPPVPPACPWDTAPEGGDGTVGLGDLNALLSNWGPCPAPCAWDFAPEAGDDTVGLGDLNALLSNWGPCS